MSSSMESQRAFTPDLSASKAASVRLPEPLAPTRADISFARTSSESLASSSSLPMNPSGTSGGVRGFQPLGSSSSPAPSLLTVLDRKSMSFQLILLFPTVTLACQGRTPDVDEWDALRQSFRHGCDRIGHARSGCSNQNARLACYPGIGIGGKPSSTLMPEIDHTDALVPAAIVDGHDASAAQCEDLPYPLSLECLGHQVAAG